MPSKKPTRKEGTRQRVRPVKGEPSLPRTRRRSTDAGPPLTPEETEYRAKLMLCSPQERKFVKFKLLEYNNTGAAIRSGYSAKRADSSGSDLMGRRRVKDAIAAGYLAGDFSLAQIRASVGRLYQFDPAEICTDVYQPVADHLERPAVEVAEETNREIVIVRAALQDLKLEEADEAEIKPLQMRLSSLRLRLMDLEIALDRNPQAQTIVMVERLQAIPLIDPLKAKEKGLSRYIKSTKRDKFGYQIELHSYGDALDRAAKMVGAYVERHEHSGPGGAPIQTQFNIEDLSGNQIAEAYSKMLEQAEQP